jgi:tetratricopeptide (TPR) repeat protein
MAKAKKETPQADEMLDSAEHEHHDHDEHAHEEHDHEERLGTSAPGAALYVEQVLANLPADSEARAPFENEIVMGQAIKLDEMMVLGNYDDALEAANELVAQIPLDPHFYVYRGMVYVQKEQMDEAMTDFERAIELDPGYVRAYYQRGIASYQINKIDDAIGDFKTAIKLEGNYAPAYMQRGYCFYARGGLPAALSDFKQYSKLMPDDPIGYNNQAFISMRMGRTSQAESLWKRSTSLIGAPHWAYAGYAAALYKMKKRRPAVDQFRKAVEMEPAWRDQFKEMAEEFGWSPDMISAAEQMILALSKDTSSE